MVRKKIEIWNPPFETTKMHIPVIPKMAAHQLPNFNQRCLRIFQGFDGFSDLCGSLLIQFSGLKAQFQLLYTPQHFSL